MKTISRYQTRYELELRVLKITENIYRYVLMRHRYSKHIAKINFNKMKTISRSQTRHELELRALNPFTAKCGQRQISTKFPNFIF